MTKAADVPKTTLPEEPPALTPALAAALLAVMRPGFPGGEGASPVPPARPPSDNGVDGIVPNANVDSCAPERTP